ncbi:MAG: M16 family metallopeptidase [Myxococcota bacterium]
MRSALLLACAVVLTGCAKKVDLPAAAAAFPALPVPGAPALFQPPTPVKTALANGVPVYTVSDPSLPLVSVRLVLPTGSVDDPGELYGLASLGGSMLGESSGERSALEQAAAVEAQAASVSFAVGRETLQMSVFSHSDRIEKVLPLAADALLRPAMAEDDWTRVHQQHVTGVKAALDSNGVVGGLVADRLWWGAEHPYGAPSDGTVATAEAVSLKRVKEWHTTHVHAAKAAFVVVGDVTPERATKMLDEHFGSWKAAKRPARSVGAAAATTGMVIVDRPGSTQTVVSVVLAGQDDAATARAPLDVVQTVMGGSFTSRLNRRLREELGYTYGARMRVVRRAAGGTIQASSAVRGDATADALKELLGMLTAASSEGITTEEVARGRAQVITRTVDRVETRGGLASTLAGEIASGRQPSDLASWVQSLDSLEPGVIGSASAMLDPKDSLIVLVGDLKAIEADLKAAGFTEWTLTDVDAAAP